MAKAKSSLDQLSLFDTTALTSFSIDGGGFAVGWQDARTLDIRCTVKTVHRTGVEMEALAGATIAALTVYDMCKALSHAIVIGPARLLGKRGGKRAVGSLA